MSQLGTSKRQFLPGSCLPQKYIFRKSEFAENEQTQLPDTSDHKEQSFQIMSGSSISNTFHHILGNARKKPTHTAVVCGDQELSYQEFVGRILAIAFQLQKSTQPSSSRKKVLICCQDKINSLSAVFACFALQWVAIPHSSDNLESLQWILDNSTADLLLGDADVIDRIHESMPDVSIPVYDVSQCHKEDDQLFWPAKECRSDEMAMIIYSSGTTSGEKKGIEVSYRILLETTRYMNRVMAIDEEIVEYVIAPIVHAFGFGRCRAVLYAGGTVVFNNGKFNPARILLNMTKNNCNAISSVSTGIAALIDYYEPHLRKIGPSLRWLEIGSLPLPVPYRQKILEVLPNASIFINYGLTEAMRSTIINLRKDKAKIDSVGIASPGVQVAVLDDEGKLLPPYSEGEIAVQGVNLASGYWNRKDLFRAKMKNGYFTTGDLGWMDDEGFLYFAGRKDDVINSGGKKFHPIEIEHLLGHFFGARTFCICGIEDPAGRLGQVPVVCVEKNSPVTLEEVRHHLRPLLDEYMIPKYLFELQSLPITDNGKVQRAQVIKQIKADSSFIEQEL